MTLGALHSGPGKDLHENAKMFERHPKIPKVKSHGTGVLRFPHVTLPPDQIAHHLIVGAVFVEGSLDPLDIGGADDRTAGDI